MTPVILLISLALYFCHLIFEAFGLFLQVFNCMQAAGMQNAKRPWYCKVYLEFIKVDSVGFASCA